MEHRASRIDGARWVEHSSGSAPAARIGPAIVYDSAREVTVLFGGYYPNGLLDDTWEYSVALWSVYLPEVVRAYPPAP